MSAMQISHRSNRHNLRVVKTVDSEDALNEAIGNGHVTLVRKVEYNPELFSKRLLLRNYRTKFTGSSHHGHITHAMMEKLSSQNQSGSAFIGTTTITASADTTGHGPPMWFLITL